VGLLGFLPLLVIGLVAVIFGGIHKVDEGHIGLYWVGGALSSSNTEPGWHVMLPLITKMEQVQVTLQTDTVVDIPCGTSGGVMIYFDKIEVVNRLDKKKTWQTIKLYGINYDKTWIFDKIHHEINQFCSVHSLQEVYIDKFSTLDEDLAKALQRDCNKWDTGINIISIRVTKPRIPTSVRKNYEGVEQENTELIVATQKQNIVLREEETKKMQATIQAEKEAAVALINAQKEAQVALINAQKVANVSKIRIQMQIKEKEGDKTKREIEDEMFVIQQKARADAFAYSLLQGAEANRILLTPEYLRAELYKSLANNTSVYFGDSIPRVFYGSDLYSTSALEGASSKTRVIK